VLVVDADDDTRALFGVSLRLAGLEVTEAADGREALTFALVEPPALVVTEIALPLVDGYALCEVLRSDAATHAVPIVVVTGEARPAELNRMRSAGADAVLVKPAPPDALVDEVRHLLAKAHVSPPPPAARASLAGAKPMDRAAPPERPRATLSKSHPRFTTATPPLTPPTLRCPTCDRGLLYEHSHVGGVSQRHAEQWDYFRCHLHGAFQYRQRTRRLRHVDNPTALKADQS
jgi:CheY-like chemotaxis protein